MLARLGRCAVTRRQWLLVAGLALFALLSVAAVSAWNAVALQITTINPATGAYPYVPVVIGEDLYFFAYSSAVKRDLYRTHGETVTQVTHLADGVGAGWNDRPFLPPVEVGGAVLFVTNEDGSQPRKIWRTNPAAPQGAELIWSATGSEFPLAWAKAGGALLILLKLDDTHRDLWVSDGTAAGTRLLKAGFVDAVYFDAAASEAAYFHSAHADVSGDHYWRADANGATPLDTQGVISANGYLAAAIYQGDLWVTDGARVVRVPAGSTTGEVVLNGGWDYELDRLYAAGDTLYLVDRHMVAMEPIQDVLWRYNATTKVLERTGKYGAIDTLAAMGDSLYFTDTYGEPAQQATRLLRLLQTAKTPSVVSIMATGGDNGARNMVAAGSLVYLHVWRNGFDWDLWASDGTPDGTRMLTPIWRRSDGSSKFNNCPCLTIANGRIYFDKKVGRTDVELWTVHFVDTANDTDFVYLPEVEAP